MSGGSSRRAAGSRPADGRGVARAIVLLGLLAAGCAGTTDASPSPAIASTGAPDAGTPGASMEPSRSPGAPSGSVPAPGTSPASPAASTVDDGPPGARLGDPGDGGAAGDIGSFSWDGLASDAPWIVGRARVTAGAGDRLLVRTESSVPVGAWQARWAPVAGGAAGDPRPGGGGVGSPIEVAAPPAGEWSLQVTVELVGAGRVTYYWRVEVPG